MVVCPRCGAYVRDDVTQCPRCGLVRGHLEDPLPRRRRRLWTGVGASAAALLVLALVAAGTLWYLRGPDAGPDPVAQPTPGVTNSPSVTSSPPAGADANFADVYASVASGVGQVLVDTCGPTSVSGTGFLVGPDRLVTAAHVINGESRVRVEMDDMTTTATIEGVDKSIDLAVLRLDQASSGHVFTLATTDARPGTELGAIGYPLGEPKTLTVGTVSGVGRQIETESGTFTTMLQTDTAINPGNSGGPLVDLDGDVVAIADAVRADAQGIGFAIPSRTARAPLSSQGALTPVNETACEDDSDVPTRAVRVPYHYHEAINAGDYEAAVALLTPEFAARSFSNENQWHEGYRTTYDDQLEVVDAAHHESHVVVRLRFRSQQAPGYGPDGAENATCVRWDIDYDLVRTGGHWLIDGASGYDDPPWTRC